VKLRNNSPSLSHAYPIHFDALMLIAQDANVTGFVVFMVVLTLFSVDQVTYILIHARILTVLDLLNGSLHRNAFPALPTGVRIDARESKNHVERSTVVAEGATHPLIDHHSQEDLRRFAGRHSANQGTAFVADEVRRSVF
jgi:hypothetical protein